MDTERAFILIYNLIVLLQELNMSEEEIFEEIGMTEDEIDMYYDFLDEEDGDEGLAEFLEMYK